MRYLVLVFMFCILSVGCKNQFKKTFEVPNPKEMASILADVHLAESTLSDYSSNISTENHPGGFNFVLNKHGLNKTEFDSAVAYYTTEPEVYQKIYEDVLTILTEKEMAARALKDDSVKISSLKRGEKSKNIWQGNRSKKINNINASSLNSGRFDFNVDSIYGGNITLKAKYKFNTPEPVKSKHKMNLFVTYKDGTRDSSETIISNNSFNKSITVHITAKQLQVKKVSGTLLTLSKSNTTSVEINDISLDWIQTLPVGGKVVE